MKYLCCENCGFLKGDICEDIDTKGDYVILKNQYEEKNVFTKEELKAWFCRMAIKGGEDSDGECSRIGVWL